MDYLLLITGFILLIKGADFFVSGSSSVAKLLKVPSIVIGLTVVMRPVNRNCLLFRGASLSKRASKARCITRIWFAS